jgi:hypothetical protein
VIDTPTGQSRILAYVVAEGCGKYDRDRQLRRVTEEVLPALD